MPRKSLPSVGRTIRAAAAAEQHDGAEIVKPGELTDISFPRGVSPSLAARRTLALLIATAGANGWKDQVHRITKREIRQGHKSNERLKDTLDEVAGIRFQTGGLSSRGRAAIVRAGLFDELIEETDDGDQSWVEFRFNRHTRALLKDSNTFAAMNRAALMALQSKYAITLYELGCLYAGRRHPEMDLTVPDLRLKLGVPEGNYSDWANLRRRVLDPAKLEIDALAHFTLQVEEVRNGRKVVRVRLRFLLKDDRGIDAAADELERPKAGRKARIRGAVEHAEPASVPTAIAPPKPVRKTRPASTEAPSKAVRKPRAKAAAEPVQLDLEDLTRPILPSPESTAKRRPPTRSQRERRRPA